MSHTVANAVDDFSLRNTHILIVDDEPDINEIYRIYLDSIGIGKITCLNSSAAMFDYLARTKQGVDLILLDIMMPETDGISTLENLKASSEYVDIPVIMLTTLNSVEKISRSLNLGADDYITKSVALAEIEERILRTLKANRATQRLKDQQQALIQENQKLQKNIQIYRRKSFTDSLTGLLNRRAFNDAFKKTWTICKTTNTPLGLILFDIDFFKRYNDTYGHPEGDLCLTQVTRALPALTPDIIPARYGGEEFVILLRGEKARQVIDEAQRLCQRVLALKIPHASSGLTPYVTISAGCTYLQNMAKSEITLPPDSLFKYVDEALYEAKRNGRNQMVFVDTEKNSYAFPKA